MNVLLTNFIRLSRCRVVTSPRDKSLVQGSDLLIDSVSWEQAWELLKKMAANPECLDSIVVCF